MVPNLCKHCDGLGTRPFPKRRWWQVWRRIDCVYCGGDGWSKPAPNSIPHPPSPPPPRKRS